MLTEQIHYRTEFEDLDSDHARFGQACLLPWDSHTFGFTAATLDATAAELDLAEQQHFGDAFLAWAKRHQVKICSCAIPANDSFWRRFLPTQGFAVVDTSLRASLTNVSATKLPRSRAGIRLALDADRSRILDLAASSFQHGRYHLDPAFPRHLGDLRYRHWMERALAANGERERVYVLEHGGTVQGFCHLVIEDSSCELRLAAIASHLQGSGLGFELYLATVRAMQLLGVRRMTTVISSANTPIMNIFGNLQFRFSHPEVIHHWHSE